MDSNCNLCDREVYSKEMEKFFKDARIDHKFLAITTIIEI